jgi:hypothetical protein
MSYIFSVTNSYFNLTYTLTSQQLADTIGAHPDGFFILVDITDVHFNLGYNTIVQNDYSNINVYITNTNQVVFNNRFVPSLGNKQFQITFITGPPNYYGIVVDKILYNAVILTYPFYSNNTLDNSRNYLTETNSYFNLTYTLTPQQLASTIDLYPQGFYILTDITDSGTNLGYNTIVQNDYANINVYITNTNQLVFNNRFVPSLGNKQLQLIFIEGPPNYYSTTLDTIMYNARVLDKSPTPTPTPTPVQFTRNYYPYPSYLQPMSSLGSYRRYGAAISICTRAQMASSNRIYNFYNNRNDIDTFKKQQLFSIYGKK